MKTRSLTKLRWRPGATGSSLVEVVIALGLTSFVLVAILGLFSVGAQDVGDSERRVDAADAASSILESRLAAPTNADTGYALPQLLANNLPAKGTVNVTATGDISASGNSPFRVTYEIWLDTNAAIATSPMARLHLLVSWPASVDPAKARGSYEVLTSTYLPSANPAP